MNHFFLLKQFLIYKWKAKSAHGIHSPFVYDFIETVLKDQRQFYAFDEIKKIRTQLNNDQTILHVEDFGAGSLHGSTSNRIVKDIARNAGRNEKFGKLLFRMVDKYQMKQILELGTSLGIGTSYLASAALDGQITTIEGSEEIANYAGKTFSSLSLKNIKQVRGNFDENLPQILQSKKHFDLIFIDGNHREEPTLKYFNLILSSRNDSEMILIFDDIHWSRGMQNAWNQIKNDPRVLLTIDLFFFGIVFFRKEFKEKQNFILNF